MVVKAFHSFSVAKEKMLAFNDNPPLNQYQEILFKLLKTGIETNQRDLLPILENYQNIGDSIADKIVKEEIIKTREIYETEKKEQENEQLHKDNKLAQAKIHTQQLFNYLTITIGLLFFLTTILLFKRSKEKTKLNEILRAKNDELLSYNVDLVTSLNSKDIDYLLESDITLSDKYKTTLSIKDILFLESQNKAILVHTVDGSFYRDWQTLKSYTKILPESLFQQSHRSYIVNKKHIKKKRKNEIILVNDQKIPISKKYEVNFV